MRLMMFAPPILTLSLIALAVPAFSQVAPAYQAHGLPLAIGVGPSNFNPDWGSGRMWGGTVWADWYPAAVLHGLGLEVEARDISLNRSLPSQKNVRQDTAAGGPIYTWRRYTNFRPYAKLLIGFGSYDFPPASPTYSHDTRGFYAPGGGVEYRFFGPLWARADYEYEILQPLTGVTRKPQGFTFGVSYKFLPRVR
jgi:opacity protein-like surface antigen